MNDALDGTDIIAIGHQMTTGKQGSLFTTINGKPSLVCYQAVPGTNWSLALVCPESDILHHYYKLSYVLVPLLVIGFILIFLLTPVFMKIAFGKAEDIRDKERVILEILEQNPDNVAYINVRMVNSPTWRAV